MKIPFFSRKKSTAEVVSRHEPEGVRVLADMYWKTLLVLAVVVTIGAIVFGVWGLLRVLDAIGSAVRIAPPPPPALNRAVLDATMRGFENRRTNFERLKTTPGETIPDPSI